MSVKQLQSPSPIQCIQLWVWRDRHHLGVVESNWRSDTYTPLEMYLLLK